MEIKAEVWSLQKYTNQLPLNNLVAALFIILIYWEHDVMTYFIGVQVLSISAEGQSEESV